MFDRREFLTKIPSGLLGLGLAASAPGRLFEAMAQGRALTIAYPADVPNWDPTSNGSTLVLPLHKCVFEQPFNLTPDLTFGPSIVEDYRWLNEEGTALELTLREGVTFHNGDPVTSEDIKFTYYDRLQADKRLMLAGVWGSIVRAIETPNPRTAIFRLNAPYPNAPQQLGSTASFVLPKKYIESVGYQEFMNKPIGAGPYKLVDYQRESRIVLEAYDKYWAGAPKIRQVVFQIIKDASARISAIQAGQVDVAINLPVREVLRLGQLPNIQGVAHPVNSVVLIQMINKGIFKDQNLRLAMHHAIDKQAMSKAFFNNQAEVLSMWSGKGAPANDPSYSFAYSQDKAKQLLAASGYSTKNPIKIPFATFNGVFPNDYDMARAIVQMWKQVGIEADLQVMDLAHYSDQSRSDKLEVPVLYNWTNPTGDPASYSGSLLDPRKIFSVWKSDDIVPRLDPLLKEINYQKRMAGYREFDKWVVEQGYAFPLLMSTATVVHSKTVKYVPFKNGWTLPAYWSMA